MNSTYKELVYIKRKINNYLQGEENLITVLGKPLDSNEILYDTIKNIIKKRGNVLYIWGNSKIDKRLVTYINKENEYYSYTREDTINKNLVFMNFKYLYNINRQYDLVIIDDISAYSKLSKESFKSLYKKIRRYTDKVILYSWIQFDEGSSINALNIDKKIFVEPRVITTRIDLKNDIPYVLYEYILWFKDNKKNVITYVPYKDDVGNVFHYYNKKVKLSDAKEIKIYREKIKDSVLKFKDKSIFLITNNIEEVLETPNIDGIILLFADNYNIDFKKILFMCAKVSKSKGQFKEMILVCNTETEEIDKAREVARSFNKLLWEEY